MLPLKWIGKLNYQKKTLKYDNYTLVYYENILKKLSIKKRAKNIVLLNSFGDDETTSKELAFQIKHNGHIYILSLLNNIHSTLTNRDQKITYKLLIKSFTDFIISLNLEDILLVSLSSASTLATLLAAHCPKVKELILVSPLTPDNIIDSCGVFVKDKVDVASFVDNRLFYKPNQIMSNLKIRNILRNQKKYCDCYQIFFDNLKHDMSEHHWEHQLKKIKVPVTIIRGAVDPISTVYDIKNIKKHLKHTTVEYIGISKARHYVYQQKNRQVAKIIKLIAKSMK